MSVACYNLLLSVATLLFVDRAVGFVSSIQSLTLLESRKIIHLVATSTVLGWRLFDESHWTWRLASLTCGLYSIKLLCHGFGLVPSEPEFYRTMTRSGRAMELCQGPLLFASIIFLVCNFEFKTDLGTYLIAAMGIGDGVAPLVGTRYPWLPYRSLGSELKTVSGSMAMFVGTFSGVYALSLILGAPSTVEPTTAARVALVAMLAEAMTGAWDNLAVPLTIIATQQLST